MNRSHELIERLDALELDEGVGRWIKSKLPWSKPQRGMEPRTADEWDRYADEHGDPRGAEFYQDDASADYGAPQQHLTTRELKKLERERQQALRQEFAAMNPHVLARLKQNMNARDWTSLTKMFAKGAFWVAAGIALPAVFIPAGLFVGAKTVANRQKVKRAKGITSRIRFTQDTGYQKGDIAGARRHLKMSGSRDPRVLAQYKAERAAIKSGRFTANDFKDLDVYGQET